MSEQDEAPPVKIKVNDRRLFDADGNFREDVPDEPTPAPAEATNEPAAPPAPEPQAADAESSAPEAPAPEPVAPQPTPAEAPAPEAAAPPAESESETPEAVQYSEEALMRFIEEQYIGGLLALGAMPEPQTGQVMEDLDLAQVRIEMLGLLREHADASLSMEARKGVDDVIYQLRMAYLQKRKVVKL